MARPLQPRTEVRKNWPLKNRMPALEADVDELEGDIGSFGKKLDRIVFLLIGILLTMLSSVATIWGTNLV